MDLSPRSLSQSRRRCNSMVTVPKTSGGPPAMDTYIASLPTSTKPARGSRTGRVVLIILISSGWTLKARWSSGEDKSSQRENPLGPHQNAQKSTIGTSLSTGHKAPKDDNGHTASSVATRSLYQVHGR